MAWENIYIEKDKWLLDWFGKKAYSEYKKWICNNDKKILDAGFGSGRFCIALSKDFPKSEIYGIDISPRLVDNANKLKKELSINNVHFEQGDIFNIPFPDEYFDVVFNEGVIEHLEDYEGAFREMYRVVKKGGILIVGVPNWYNFVHTFRKWCIERLNGEYEYGYEKSFKHKELINMFKKYGLKNVEMTGYYSMQSVIRLSGFSRHHALFSFLGVSIWGRLIEKLIIYPLDKLTKNGISKKFGFEIVIKGIK